MAKRYPAKARELAIALYLDNLSVPEITKRFNEGTAGLIDKEAKPQPIPITSRRVAEYIAEHKAKHGPRKEPEDQELTADSISRVKHRALNVLAREIAHLESLPKGRITAKQSTALRQHYATLDDMERRQELAEKRKGKGKRRGKAPASGDKPQSAIDALVSSEIGQINGHAMGHGPSRNTPESQTESRIQVDITKDISASSRGLSKEELEEIMGSARA